ncbi:MAG TPA: hypothetical protein VNF99_15450 [Stellaceae bacterium]|nr:hypothetical protein [Stellaceae bacterium]
MKRASKLTFLAVYNYGQGGVWFLIIARSKDEIAAKYPELTVVDARPQWMTVKGYERIAPASCIDIDDEPHGWVQSLVEHRKKTSEP